MTAGPRNRRLFEKIIEKAKKEEAMTAQTQPLACPFTITTKEPSGLIGPDGKPDTSITVRFSPCLEHRCMAFLQMPIPDPATGKPLVKDGKMVVRNTCAKVIAPTLLDQIAGALAVQTEILKATAIRNGVDVPGVTTPPEPKA